MSSMFSQCASLSSLDLSNFRTNSIEFIPEMFNGCRNL
jgi:surface protein